MIKFLFIFIFLLVINLCEAQSPYFKHFTVDNNLPSSECYQVLQDKKGYIWIATDKGVARYDGYQFKNFTKEDGLPENCILRMYEDPKGRIWFAGLSGKLAYFSKNKFNCLKTNNLLSMKIKGGVITSIAYYDNALWIGTCTSKSIFKISLGLNKKINPNLHDLNKDLQYQGPYIFSFKNGEFMEGNCPIYKKFNFNYSLNGEKHIIVQDFEFQEKAVQIVRATNISENEYLYYLSDELITIHKKTGKIKNVQKTNLMINYLFSDSKKGLWIGTMQNGLHYFKEGNILKSKPFIYLKGKSISCIMEDREGGYWITTLDHGLYYLGNINFTHITAISNPKVNSLAFFQKKLYAGLANGQLVIANDYLFSEKDLNYVNPDPNALIIKNGIRTIYPINNESLMIGGAIGLSQFNTKTNKIIWLKYRFPNKKTKYYGPHGLSTFVYHAKTNSFWIATFSFLQNIKDPFQTKQILENKKLNNKIYNISEDDNGILWFATTKGLFHFDGVKFTFEGKNSIALSNRINDVKISGNSIWNATKEFGICIKRGDSLHYITVQNGLPSNICQSLFLESEKIGWIATNKGISKVIVERWNPLKLKIKNYNLKNGLITNEVNQILKKGTRVFLGTNNGITWFDENKVITNKTPPPIYITNVSINKKNRSNKKLYELAYNQNNIDIHFVGLTYKNIGDVGYKFRMIGLDTNWTKTNFTKTNFTTLPYGNYTFEVIAKNNDGIYSEEPAKIQFVISPPFWHTWSFRIIAGILFIVSLYSFIRWRINKVEKRALENAKLYHQTIEMEMKFLSSQMNPHFTFNAMNSIQYYLIDNEPEKAQKYLVKYSKLIRKVLENNMKKFVPLNEEIEMLELYMDIESLRFAIKFDYKISLLNELKEMNILIPPMIIQPFVENAIWHGISFQKEVKGKIEITFEIIDNKLICSIQDNGIGIKKSNELKSKNTNKESLGMLITNKRLQQLHSELQIKIEPEIIDLFDDNGEACGTKVIIHLPYIESATENNFE